MRRRNDRPPSGLADQAEIAFNIPMLAGRLPRSLLLALAALPATARAGDFCADRPGLATGTCIVDPGRVQLEASFADWSRTTDSGASETDWLLGAGRLRFGIGGGTDLQIAFAPHVGIRTRGDTNSRVSGVGDLSLALKHRLLDGTSFSLAVLPFVKVPTAKDSLGNGKWEGGVLVPMEIDLAAPFSLTLTPEIDVNADEDGPGRHLRTAFAASLGAELSDDWSIALDTLFGRERDQGTSREASVGLSVTRTIGDNAQLDAELDTGLSRDVPDWRLVSGIGVRF